ncbi:MAG: hypothetical protein ACK2UM_00085 [Anaerolineales bacterium]|jgi:hypothetical protein
MVRWLIQHTEPAREDFTQGYQDGLEQHTSPENKTQYAPTAVELDTSAAFNVKT